jgi:hypothetical protein
VPPAATPKMVAIEIAAFLGLPVSSHDSQQVITQAVAEVLRKVGCSLVLVDEVHRLDLRTRAGAAASDQLKYFFDSISATFVYAGLDLAQNGMFSGTRGRQIAGRETVVSYAHRLSVANELPPTAILRALGQLTNTGSGTHLLTYDAWLNEQALGRLEAYTGMPRSRLSRALPTLRWKAPALRPLPQDRPALYLRQTDPRARPACRRCQLAAGRSGPAVLVRPGATGLVCYRHKRWLGTSSETGQYDLSGTRQIIAASRRRTRLITRSDDSRWAARIFDSAWTMTLDWTECHPRRMPVFSQRWRDRATALGITTTSKRPPRIVTLPEAVKLASILTDLNWRRYVALEWDTQPFYQHIAHSIGEQSYPRWALINDPISRWIHIHRARFADARHSAWRHPVPENRHFK